MSWSPAIQAGDISAVVAQLEEQLICNHQVGGSSPSFGSIASLYKDANLGHNNALQRASPNQSFFISFPPIPTRFPQKRVDIQR